MYIFKEELHMSKLHINQEPLTAIMARSEENFSNIGKTCVEDMVDYYKAVYMLDHQITVWKATLDDDEFRRRLQTGDRRRRVLHDSAMASLSVANRLANKLQLGSVIDFDIEVEYRGDVADAMFDYVETVVSKDPYRQ